MRLFTLMVTRTSRGAEVSAGVLSKLFDSYCIQVFVLYVSEHI